MSIAACLMFVILNETVSKIGSDTQVLHSTVGIRICLIMRS